MPDYRNMFKKELVKMVRRGKDVTKIITIIGMLMSEIPLPESQLSFPLRGKDFVYFFAQGFGESLGCFYIGYPFARLVTLITL